MTEQKPAKRDRQADESQDAFLAHAGDGAIRRYVFPAGTVLFNRGDTRQCAYLIDQGEVHIHGDDEAGREKLLCTLSEGEIFGEMALVDDTPRTARAVTATEAEIFVIPREALQDRVKGLDPIVSLLISLLIERYRVTRIHLPESIKQDRAGDFIQKISRHENLPEGVLRLRNAREQRESALREMKLEQELRIALEERQFIPVFQPILSLPARRLAGFEALVRWHHPQRGIVSPAEFIPVAERTGLVQHIDRLMLERSCELLPQILEAAGSDAEKLFISVNLSGINFGTSDVINTVRGTLLKYDADPSHIKLEITESALIGDPAQAQKILNGLKAIGVSIALDDFGTGYSSLGYLHKFPIDDLKIDRSFVAQMNDGSKSIDIVRAIVGLARNFKLNIVAEGIEREQDVIAINSLGCDMGQGYLFSKPIALEDALKFVKASLQTPVA